jgi:hypothetical protein
VWLIWPLIVVPQLNNDLANPVNNMILARCRSAVRRKITVSCAAHLAYQLGKKHLKVVLHIRLTEFWGLLVVVSSSHWPVYYIAPMEAIVVLILISTIPCLRT